jgi:hypothetical protein
MASATAGVNCKRFEMLARNSRGRSDIAALVCEDVLLRPPLEIKAGAVWNEAETRVRQVTTTLALQHCVKLLAQSMQPKDISSRILELLRTESLGTPVGALLLFRQLDSQQFATQILEAVPIGVGANQLGCDLGAVDRRTHHAEPPVQHPHIESCEMKQLDDTLVGQQCLEIGRRVGGVAVSGSQLRREMHEMAYTVAAGQLYQAEAVTMRIETGRLRVDGDAFANRHTGRKIPVVQLDVDAVEVHDAAFPVCGVSGFIFVDGDGAQEKTRTSTASRPQVPETCASTNSATWASAFVRFFPYHSYEDPSPAVNEVQPLLTIRTVLTPTSS